MKYAHVTGIITMLAIPMARYQEDDRNLANATTAPTGPSFAGALYHAYTPITQHHPSSSYAYTPGYFSNSNSTNHNAGIDNGNNTSPSTTQATHNRYPPAFPLPRQQQQQPPSQSHIASYSPTPNLNYSHSSTTPTLPPPSASHYQQSPIDQPYQSPASAYIQQSQWSDHSHAANVAAPSATLESQHAAQWRGTVISPYWTEHGADLAPLPPVELSRTQSLPTTTGARPPTLPSHASWDMPVRQSEVPDMMHDDESWPTAERGAAHTLITPPASTATLTKLESPTHDESLSGSCTAGSPADVDSSYGTGPLRQARRSGASRSKRASIAGPSCWKGRTGPLSQTTREKSVSLREFGACWRCKKYRKPCTGGPGMCETCSTSGFRVWPSEIGCRRGNFDAFVDLILPPSAETTLKDCCQGFSKRQQWRRLLDAKTLQAAQDASAFATKDVRWRAVLYKVLGTRIFGQEFVELFEIVANFQQSACREHPSLDAACTMLSSTCDFYNTFIEIGPRSSSSSSATTTQCHTQTSAISSADLPHVLRTIRKSFSRALRLVLAGCLSGRASEWLPALLTCVVMCCAVVMLADVAFAMPAELRRLIWPDITEMYADVKSNLYTTVCHLLNALAKGSKPLKMTCWRFEGVADPEGSGNVVGRRRNEQGMQLVGRDEACFDGVRKLQEWLGRHEGVVVKGEGREWTERRPFSMATVPTISIAGALFEC